MPPLATIVTAVEHGFITLNDEYKSGAAYCYNMQDNKLECVYVPSEDNGGTYTTRPSWFVPS